MDIYWYGQSLFKIKGKSATVVIDPFDPQIGLKLPKELSADIVLSSHAHYDHNNVAFVGGNPLIVTGPGDYEKNGISIRGISTYHDSTSGSERGKNTAYHLLIDGVNVVHLGDLGHLLSEEQITQIGEADILMIPVGGNYTIDAENASKVVTQLEPRIVIPMHYKIDEVKVDIEGLGPFLKELGAENIQPVPKLSVTKDKLPEETTVVVLSKS